jgi:hypothetical protein
MSLVSITPAMTSHPPRDFLGAEEFQEQNVPRVA